MQVRGSHVGTYLPSSGIWHHTQRFLKKGVSNSNTVCHLDFDAPTREHAALLPDDKVHLVHHHWEILTKFFEIFIHSFSSAMLLLLDHGNFENNFASMSLCVNEIWKTMLLFWLQEGEFISNTVNLLDQDDSIST